MAPKLLGPQLLGPPVLTALLGQLAFLPPVVGQQIPGMAAGGEVSAAVPEEPAEPGSSVRTLGPEEIWESAAAGEQRRFSIPSPGDHAYLRLEVEQAGADVFLRLTGPGGRELLADQPMGYHEPERLLVPAGAYQLDVDVRSPGRFAVRWHPALADELRFEADRAWTEATQLYAEGDPASRPRALESFLHAAELYGAAGLERDQARALAGAGHLAADSGDAQRGTALLRRAIEARRRAGDLRGEAEGLHLLGQAHRLARDLDAAGQAFQQSFDLSEDLGDELPQARALLNLGFLAQRTGEASAARRHYEKALELARPPGDRRLIVKVLNNLGGLDFQAGDLAAAIEAFEALLELQDSPGDQRSRARTYINLAAARRALGRYQSALTAYEGALETLEPLGDLRLEASTFNNLGFTYLSLGETTKARDYLEQALPLRRSAGDRRGEAVTVGNLGRVALAEGELADAEKRFRQALGLFREVKERRGEAGSLHSLGRLEVERGDAEAAQAHLRASAALHHGLGNRQHAARVDALLARALLAASTVGGTHGPSGESLREAKDLADAAVSTQRELGDLEGEAESLWVRARIHRAAARTDVALEDLEAALEIAESLRVGVLSPDLRASFLAVKRSIYEETVDLLMEDGGPSAVARAFSVAEQARARALLDVLSGAGHPGLSPVRRAEREQMLERLTALRYRLGRDQRRGVPVDPERAAEARELSIALDRLAGRAGEAVGRMPEEQGVLVLGDLQGLLDGQTALAVFSLGEARSYLWVVRRDGMVHATLPARAEIEARVREVYEDLRTFDPRGAREETRRAEALGDLLFGAVWSELDVPRLAVVAEGSLLHLPFAALPTPGDGLLVESHEVLHLPSASLLPELRRRSAQPAAPRLLAVVADPLFAPPGSPPAPPASSELTRGSLGAVGTSAAEVEIPLPSRLPASREEATHLARIAGGRAKLWLGAEARKPSLLGDALSPYRYVHFATHASVDSRRPELSSLALSLFDDDGQAVDGYLRLHDVYELSLAADLVVLSGCETALGRDVAGEGFLGLTRGFFFAGAAKVAASLWRVEDRATAELMSLFYSNMLDHDLGPAAALRRAQLSLRGQRRFKDPFYWAAFVVYGDWTTR